MTDVWKAPQSALEDLRDALDEGKRPTEWHGQPVTYHEDPEQGEQYARTRYTLPDDTRIFAEFEDGSDPTYGRLIAVRIYIPAD